LNILDDKFHTVKDPIGFVKPIDNSFWHSLFVPDSIAVIGANDTLGSWGSDAIAAAVAATKSDPKKRAYAVNPNARQVLGVTSYGSILDIPDTVELAIIVVRSSLVADVLRQCVQKGVKAAVVISAGFAETDEDGTRLQGEIVDIARRGGIRFVGPNCIGHADLHSKVSALGVTRMGKPGPMALISQSGTVSAGIMQAATSRGIGISKFVSTGNEADLHMEDYLEYLLEDDKTRIITAYIEGLREGRRFFQLAKRITLKKPIVVIKTGNSEGAGKAAKSHTGALAGSDAVIAAVFKQTGVIKADDEEELCDVALALLTQPLPKGNRVAILTIGGGFGVMTTEACEREGLKMASLGPTTMAKLDAVLPPRWSHGNPVDMVGVKTIDEFGMILSCLRAMTEDDNVDSVIALVTNRNYGGDEFRAMQMKNELALKDLGRFAKQVGKPLILVRKSFHQDDVTGEAATNFDDRIPEYARPRQAARVLGHLLRYSHYVNSI
jgi:acyl-CoA synthetase (NDP forming)